MTSRFLHGLEKNDFSMGDWSLLERDEDGQLSITYRDKPVFRLIATPNVRALAMESKWTIHRHSGFQFGLQKKSV